MAARKGGIILTSLNDCFRFLYWLNKDGKGKEMHRELAGRLHDRLAKYYNNPDQSKIESSLSTFLGHVDTFYKKLVNDHIPEETLQSGASMSRDSEIRDADLLVDALLECLPKFLAAIYFLWYNVSYRFKKVGGSKWADLCPGAISASWFYKSSGGDLDQYLISNRLDDYGGLIPGGFGSYELRYGWYYSGYEQGYKMSSDLAKIFGKDGGLLFRDVFATSVLYETYGIAKQNTANALALVNKFCEIVGKEAKNNNGGTLKAKLDEEIIKKRKCSINWESLKLHCEHLQQQLGKIFNEGAFSFTGYGRGIEELKTTEFAQQTAEWLRNNLHEVMRKLDNIEVFRSKYDNFDMSAYSKNSYLLTQYYDDLGPHFTKNLFPYGFTFYSTTFGASAAPYYNLRHDWESVIKTLSGSDENGGLKKLKTILDGEKCTPAPPPKPRPRPAPAPRPPRPARPAPPPKPTTGNSSGAQGFRGAGGNRNSGNGGQMESGARRVKGSGGAGYRRGSGAQRSATQVKSVAQSRTASRLSHVQASSAQKAAQPQNADNSSSQQVAGPQQLVEIKAPPAPSVSVSRNHATSSTTTVQEPDIPSVSPQEKPGHIASSHTPATPGRSGTSGDSNDQARSSNPFVQPGVSVSSSVSNPPNGQTLPTDRVVSSAAAIHPTTHRAASDGGDGIGGNGTAGEMGSTGGSDSTGSSTSLPHPPPPAQLEPLPASHDVTAVPELPKEVVPEKKVTVIKAPEPITPKIAEGTNKLEGTPIHGGTLGVNPMQDNNQNTEKSPSPVVVTSVQVVSPGSDHQNPQGSEADQSPHAVGGNDSVASSDSSVQDPVLTQQHVTQSTYMSQSPSSPSSAAHRSTAQAHF
ncbi:hypothetical protein, conserved, partial [Babesia bigemina]